MRKLRVAVTGIGLVTPAGCTVTEFLRSLYAYVGNSRVRKIRHFDTTGLRTRLAATFDNFDPHHFSIKPVTGHMLAAREQLMPPTINYEEEDPQCGFGL